MAALIIFDCDGVLVDSEYLIAQVEAELFRAHGATISVDDVVSSFVGLSEDAMAALLQRDWHVEYTDALREQRNARVAEAMATRVKAIPGIDELVAALPVPVCVASSTGPVGLRQRLTVTGLIRHFDGKLFSSVMVKHGKPAPDVFLFAARQMRTEPTACVVVEDSVHGVEAGRAAGMHVIGFTAGSHATATLGDQLAAHGAHEVVDSADGLARALATHTDAR